MSYKRINSAIFIFILIFFSLWNLFFHSEEMISNSENRRLTDWPEFTVKALFEGSYTEQIELYLGDRFPLRAKGIAFISYLENLRGIQSDDDFVLIQTSGVNEGESVTSSESQIFEIESKFVHDKQHFPDDVGMLIPIVADTSKNVTKITFDEDFKTNILIYNQKGMTSFQRQDELIESLAASYMRIGNRYPEIKMYALMAPSQVAFVDEAYFQYTDSQYEGIQAFYEKLGREITAIDPYAILDRHRDDYIYFRTDHHWTSLGAYYAYLETCRQMNLSPNGYDTLSFRSYGDFLGSIYNLTQNQNLKDNPDSLYAFVPIAKFDYLIYDKDSLLKTHHALISDSFDLKNYQYRVFLGGDFGFSVIKNKSDPELEETLLVIKDSYGNAWVPFIADHFRTTIVYDPRYTDRTLQSITEAYNIDKMIVVNSGQALTSKSYIETMKTIQ